MDGWMTIRCNVISLERKMIALESTMEKKQEQ